MEWRKWCMEDLPDPGEKVILWYKSGYTGCVNFFYSEESKKMYIEGMKYILEHHNYIDEIPDDHILAITHDDPIIFWMPFPEPHEDLINGMD